VCEPMDAHTDVTRQRITRDRHRSDTSAMLSRSKDNALIAAAPHRRGKGKEEPKVARALLAKGETLPSRRLANGSRKERGDDVSTVFLGFRVFKREGAC